jgi:hypothetical protein
MPSLLRGFFLPGFTTAIHYKNNIINNHVTNIHLKNYLKTFLCKWVVLKQELNRDKSPGYFSFLQNSGVAVQLIKIMNTCNEKTV